MIFNLKKVINRIKISGIFNYELYFNENVIKRGMMKSNIIWSVKSRYVILVSIFLLNKRYKL